MDAAVSAVAGVVGSLSVDFHVSLSAMDVQYAFVVAQGGKQRQQPGGEGAETISFDEFVTCVALCGCVKYSTVEQMSLAQRVAGIVANFLGEKDEQQVITEAVVPKVERFDPTAVKPPPHVSEASHHRFLTAWKQMDLSELFGFPLWEKQVFVRLLASFDELAAIFAFYADGGNDGNDGGSADSIEQTELVDLALDCGFISEAFPMARVAEVFASTDRESREIAGGDLAIELHEFLEALVALSFHRANPKFGDPNHVWRGKEPKPAVPLPDCLQALLGRQVLRMDRRELLAKASAQLQKDGELQELLQTHEDALRHHFGRIANRRGADVGNSFVTSQAFVSQLQPLTRPVRVPPPPEMEGSMPEVLCSFSWLDARLAVAAGGTQTGVPTLLVPDDLLLPYQAWLRCLALCGMLKYSDAPQLSPVQKAGAMLSNVLELLDEVRCHPHLARHISSRLSPHAPPPCSA
jgi:hypothetical protein